MIKCGALNVLRNVGKGISTSGKGIKSMIENPEEGMKDIVSGAVNNGKKAISKTTKTAIKMAGRAALTAVSTVLSTLAPILLPILGIVVLVIILACCVFLATGMFDDLSSESNGSYSTWDGSGNTFGIDIFVNGHVSDENMTKLRAALEEYYGLPKITMPIENSLWVCDKTISATSIKASKGYKKYDYTKSLKVAQCTWWAYVRSNQYLEAYGTKYKSIDDAKKHIKITDRGGVYGNGGMWGGRYSQVFNSGSKPKTNSIFSYGGNNPGHVGYVEAVDGEYMYISHCGSGEKWHGLNKVKISDFNSRNSPKYVYLAEPK